MNTPLSRPSSLGLSIIIPAYNEENRLISTLKKAYSFCDEKKYSYEIIVVDDGSSDQTSRVAENTALELNKDVLVRRLEQNIGKGNAIKEGILQASGEIVGFMDADGATPIEELEKMLSALEANDISIGSRALFSDHTAVRTIWYRKVLGRIFNNVVNLIALPGIKDTQCGFKFFRRSTAQVLFPHLRTKRFGVDVEILYLARKNGYSIAEIPVNWTNIPGSKVNLLKDSTDMFFDVLRVMWRHR